MKTIFRSLLFAACASVAILAQPSPPAPATDAVREIEAASRLYFETFDRGDTVAIEAKNRAPTVRLKKYSTASPMSGSNKTGGGGWLMLNASRVQQATKALFGASVIARALVSISNRTAS